ncbi:MAG: hypothetical protein KKD44_16710 [Proteobacteria bacterium]|nr:hypothetical protein [Pseudomonadota bacterium]
MTDKYCRAGKVIINDTEEYFVRVTERKHGFEVINTNKDIILTSSIYQPSRFKAFLGWGEHQLKDDGKIIGRIKYHGFLGLRRSVDVGGNISSLPRKHMTWSGIKKKYSRGRSRSISTSGDSRTL